MSACNSVLERSSLFCLSVGKKPLLCTGPASMSGGCYHSPSREATNQRKEICKRRAKTESGRRRGETCKRPLLGPKRTRLEIAAATIPAYTLGPFPPQVRITGYMWDIAGLAPEVLIAALAQFLTSTTRAAEYMMVNMRCSACPCRSPTPEGAGQGCRIGNLTS
jgi:hypothetical protein